MFDSGGGGDVAVLDDDALVAEVFEAHRALARAQARCARLAAEVERRPVIENATTVAGWLAWRCRITKSQARLELSNGRAVRRMPEVAAAHDAGEVTAEHVRLLAAAHRSNAEAFEKAETELLEDACRLRFDVFARRVAYFRQAADLDGVERDAQDVCQRRKAHCSRTFEDTVQVDALLDPVGGGIVKNELDRLERKLFADDWADARERLGAVATNDDLARTPEQRRADALVEMAKRSATLGDTNLARALITVLVGYETFAGRMCQLADGTVVTPGQVVPLLDDADVERVVFGGPSRVIDVGRRRRLFTGADRRAVEVRDLECTEESCDVPYDRCEVDHVERWEHGGETVQENGRLRCPRHHPGRKRRP
jgi:hypothetical protein